MTRFVLAVACFCIPVLGHSQSVDKNLPKRIDTVQVHQAVTLTRVQGDILMKSAGDALVPVANGSVILPGGTLLVRKGAAFAIGSNYFAGESYGDRWVHLTQGSGSFQINSTPFPDQRSPTSQTPPQSQSSEVVMFETNSEKILSDLRGEVLVADATGTLVPLKDGSVIVPGRPLMVRSGASFYIGSRFFAPRSSGDRWVQIAGPGSTVSSGFNLGGVPVIRPSIGNTSGK